MSVDTTASRELWDEDLMRRFLVDDVTDGERQRIEEAFIADAEYLDALCALEEEMIRDHVRGELPELWRGRFATTLLKSPARQRRVDEIRALTSVLRGAAPTAGVSGPAGAPEQPPAAGTGESWARVGLLAAAAVVVLTAGAVVLLRERVAQPTEGAPPVVTSSPQPAATIVATLDLVPPTRAPGGRNLLRLTENTGAVTVTFTVIDAVDDIDLKLTRSGRPEIVEVPGKPVTARVADGVAVRWTIPAEHLVPDTYIIGVTALNPSGARQEYPKWSFMIAP